MPTEKSPAEKVSTRSSVQRAFDQAIAESVARVTLRDRASAKEIAEGDEEYIRIPISSIEAAAIYDRHNGRNRELSIPKVLQYKDAMLRHEWKYTPQGIAFDTDGRLVDGQHRITALALTDMALDFLVVRKVDRTVIDAIDQSKPRRASEALQIAGISRAGEKERIARAALEYTSKVDKHPMRPTIIQIERYVTSHDLELNRALEYGKMSVFGKSEACMSETLAATIAYLFIIGEWDEQVISNFLDVLQGGVDKRENGVIVPAARILALAKRKENKKDTLTRDQQIATVLKAAQHWIRDESVARFRPVKKNDLVDYHSVIRDEDILGAAD